MSKDQTVQAVPATPTIPEVTGISTAVDQIHAVEARLITAISAASQTEKELEAFRKSMNDMKDGIQKSFLVAHQAELEAQIADASRKAVSDALNEVRTHVATVQTLAAQIQAKHGKPVVTVKHADRGTGRGDITSGNMDALRELLQSRGISVQFELQEDGKHYYAVDPASGRKSKYASNVRSDWV
jgi:hypothetical protein